MRMMVATGQTGRPYHGRHREAPTANLALACLESAIADQLSDVDSTQPGWEWRDFLFMNCPRVLLKEDGVEADSDTLPGSKPLPELLSSRIKQNCSTISPKNREERTHPKLETFATITAEERAIARRYLQREWNLLKGRPSGGDLSCGDNSDAVPLPKLAVVLESLSLNPRESLEGMADCYKDIVEAGKTWIEKPVPSVLAALTPVLRTRLPRASGKCLLHLAILLRSQSRWLPLVGPTLVRKGAVWSRQQQEDMPAVLAATELILTSAHSIFEAGWYQHGQELKHQVQQARSRSAAAAQLQSASPLAFLQPRRLGARTARHADRDARAVNQLCRLSIASLCRVDWKETDDLVVTEPVSPLRPRMRRLDMIYKRVYLQSHQQSERGHDRVDKLPPAKEVLGKDFDRFPLAAAYALYREPSKLATQDTVGRVHTFFRGAACRWTLLRSSNTDQPGRSRNSRVVSAVHLVTVARTAVHERSMQTHRSKRLGVLPTFEPFSCDPNLDELHQYKIRVKHQLKEYDAAFYSRRRRKPLKEEKEPIRHLYESYKEIKRKIYEKENFSGQLVGAGPRRNRVR